MSATTRDEHLSGNATGTGGGGVAFPAGPAVRPPAGPAGGTGVPEGARYRLPTRRGRRSRRGARPTIMLGTGRHARRLASVLLDHPEHGLAPIGFVDDGPPAEHTTGPASGRSPGRAPGRPAGRAPERMSDRPERFAAALREHRVRAVVVASAPVPGTDAPVLARIARDLGCEVFLAPEPGGLLADFLPPHDHVRGFPLLRMRPVPQARPSWRLKRLLDIAVALIGLLVTAPLLALCALAVRCEGGPGVLFRQSRVGLGGRRFQMLKLRTLHPSDPRESETRWSIAGDERVGRVGRLLRRTSLDELPQLWNVLRGDMSIVGPRPERPFFVDQFSRSLPHYASRHRVPAGITGWAQVHGLRGDTSIEDRARLDNHYIDGWTLRSDLKIIARTVGSVLRPSGG
ncbi:sugar transferase [Planomonospora sp. ID82291]|uniref:sugar transferase n=1 Tax=Planomonospora sp. ID82291 TaxID=2738136 RepID=UPI0018C3F3BD|nr:sugar transferase [Planomonospora sp. ID82291]MBG0813272.1 sugar transferase [Planomonospora sp. ID82291]